MKLIFLSKSLKAFKRFMWASRNESFTYQLKKKSQRLIISHNISYRNDNADITMISCDKNKITFCTFVYLVNLYISLPYLQKRFYLINIIKKMIFSFLYQISKNIFLLTVGLWFEIHVTGLLIKIKQNEGLHVQLL